jgi:hypothetical protein
MFVFFCLEDVVVMSALGDVVGVVVGAVVADLLGAGAESVFVFADQFRVLGLFGFEEFDGTVGL